MSISDIGHRISFTMRMAEIAHSVKVMPDYDKCVLMVHLYWSKLSRLYVERCMLSPAQKAGRSGCYSPC